MYIQVFNTSIFGQAVHVYEQKKEKKNKSVLCCRAACSVLMHIPLMQQYLNAKLLAAISLNCLLRLCALHDKYILFSFRCICF